MIKQKIYKVKVIFTGRNFVPNRHTMRRTSGSKFKLAIGEVTIRGQNVKTQTNSSTVIRNREHTPLVECDNFAKIVPIELVPGRHKTKSKENNKRIGKENGNIKEMNKNENERK